MAPDQDEHNNDESYDPPEPWAVIESLQDYEEDDSDPPDIPDLPNYPGEDDPDTPQAFRVPSVGTDEPTFLVNEAPTVKEWHQSPPLEGKALTAPSTLDGKTWQPPPAPRGNIDDLIVPIQDSIQDTNARLQNDINDLISPKPDPEPTPEPVAPTFKPHSLSDTCQEFTSHSKKTVPEHTTIPELNIDEDDDPGFIHEASIVDRVKNRLGSAGLTQDSIAARIMGATDPHEEVTAIFKEAHEVINHYTTGTPNAQLKTDFEASMTDLINSMNAKKKFKAGCAKVGEVTGDIILLIPDLAVGSYQALLEKSKPARIMGGWLAKTFNKKKIKERSRATGSTIQYLRMKGKETRANRGAHHDAP